MPYISNKARAQFPPADYVPTTAGELNFLITRLCDDFIRHSGGLNYANINTAVGALECAKLEIYRRVAAPYEDSKVAQNGDVYSPETLGQPPI
jgi:hypothetical protein